MQHFVGNLMGSDGLRDPASLSCGEEGPRRVPWLTGAETSEGSCDTCRNPSGPLGDSPLIEGQAPRFDQKNGLGQYKPIRSPLESSAQILLSSCPLAIVGIALFGNTYLPSSLSDQHSPRKSKGAPVDAERLKVVGSPLFHSSTESYNGPRASPWQKRETVIVNPEHFLETLSEELLSPGEFADVQWISATLGELEGAITSLREAKSAKDIEDFFSEEGAETLATLLLGTPTRWLKDRGNRSSAKRQLLHWREWTLGNDLPSIATGLLLAKAQTSRGRRRRKKFLGTVESRLSAATLRYHGSLELGDSLRLASASISRNFDFIVNYRTEPVIAVVSIFQTSSGGRQQEIFRGLPDLQDSLADDGVVLLVVADGPGFRGMSGVVEEVAPNIEYLANLEILQESYIAHVYDQAIAIREGKISRESRSFAARARVAEIALTTGRPVTPDILDLDPARMEGFLLRFRATHEDFALSSESRSEIEPENAGAIAEVLRLLEDLGRGETAGVFSLAELLSDHLGFGLEHLEDTSGQLMFGFRVKGAQLRLPDPLPVFFMAPSDRNGLADQLEQIDNALSRGKNISRIAMLIEPNDPEASRSIVAEFSRQDRSQLAVVDQEGLVRHFLLNRNAARRHFFELITSQVDLTIVSPFISEGPTPSRMFFGRELEIRRIIEQHRNQSFAIIGGRKSGKTSLLQRLRELIPQRSKVTYLDCQAHPDRVDFLSFLQSGAKAESGGPGRADLASTEAILRDYLHKEFGESPGVILLDEVDDLFLADSTADQYPHVLSRALRSMSQSKIATIVATGERSLFELTRDPASPHWNFCTPMQIGPLDQEASRQLIGAPLRELGISVGRDAVDLLLDRSAQHPNLLQYIGDALVHHLAPLAGSGEVLNVGTEQVDAVATSPDYRRRFVVTFLSQATPMERLISIELEYPNRISPEALRDRLQQRGIEVGADALIRGLEFLELYSIAVETNEGYQFRTETFPYFFHDYASDLMVEQWKEEME